MIFFNFKEKISLKKHEAKSVSRLEKKDQKRIDLVVLSS